MNPFRHEPIKLSKPFITQSGETYLLVRSDFQDYQIIPQSTASTIHSQDKLSIYQLIIFSSRDKTVVKPNEINILMVTIRLVICEWIVYNLTSTVLKFKINVYLYIWVGAYKDKECTSKKGFINKCF